MLRLVNREEVGQRLIRLATEAVDNNFEHDGKLYYIIGSCSGLRLKRVLEEIDADNRWENEGGTVVEKNYSY